MLDALCYAAGMHVKAVQTCLPPEEREIRRILDALEETYKPVKPKTLPRFPDIQAFKRLVISEIDWDSTPGIPLNKLGSNNGQIFGWNGVTVDDQRCRYIYACVKSRYEQLLKQPALDPIQLFIKPEPHKAKKRDLKAWRLIHSVSLIDNMVCRIMLGPLLEAMIDGYQDIPNKAGWTPSSGGYRFLHAKMPGRKVMADKSQWDFTLQPWIVRIYAQLLDRLTEHLEDENGFTTCWRTVVGHHLSRLFFDCQFAVGRYRIRQTTMGIMKSGWYGTIAFNSIAQVALHLLASFRSQTNWRRTMPFVLGDDTVQPDLLSETYADCLRQTGCVLKEMESLPHFVFGGHTFDDKTCVPTYKAKHAWTLLHLDNRTAAETLESYQLLYTHDDQGFRPFIQQLMKDLNYTALIKSNDYLHSWYDGYEKCHTTKSHVTTRLEFSFWRVWRRGLGSSGLKPYGSATGTSKCLVALL